ncbi:NAD-dependent epimerase/dehydratase family protein [Alcanivorax sp.]|uniref:NAD-dependent epimerase/dehydratase family protein n=1 Tax=Alcanivorax sp. TaxID=1872427 RepID=UPI00258B53D4|nr:NAD-dependent epimerase/dehydratase family protein [Alcanivorax sp.]
MKKALVTGATGFIGSHLVRALLRNGWEVDVIVRPCSSLSMLTDVEARIGTCEHAGDMQGMLDIVTVSKPDVVFHVASLFLSNHQSEQVEELIRSNVLFGTQLLEAMAASGVRKMVNTSTNWEHYEGKDYSPVNLYAATKRAFQDILQYYVEAKGVQAITLKLFDSYGPNDPRPKLLKLLLEAANTGKPLALSPGEQKIDLVHVDDVASAYLVAAERLLSRKVTECECYGVYSGKAVSIRELVRFVEEKTGRTLHVCWGGRGYRSREVMEPYYGLNPPPGWSPKHTLEQGLESLLCV